MTRGTSVDAKPKSARAEVIPATSQTESAALQDLTDEVKLNQPDIIYPAPQQSKTTKIQWQNKNHLSVVVIVLSIIFIQYNKKPNRDEGVRATFCAYTFILSFYQALQAFHGLWLKIHVWISLCQSRHTGGSRVLYYTDIQIYTCKYFKLLSRIHLRC